MPFSLSPFVLSIFCLHQKWPSPPHFSWITSLFFVCFVNNRFQHRQINTDNTLLVTSPTSPQPIKATLLTTSDWVNKNNCKANTDDNCLVQRFIWSGIKSSFQSKHSPNIQHRWSHRCPKWPCCVCVYTDNVCVSVWVCALWRVFCLFPGWMCWDEKDDCIFNEIKPGHLYLYKTTTIKIRDV